MQAGYAHAIRTTSRDPRGISYLDGEPLTGMRFLGNAKSVTQVFFWRHNPQDAVADARHVECLHGPPSHTQDLEIQIDNEFLEERSLAHLASLANDGLFCDERTALDQGKGSDVQRKVWESAKRAAEHPDYNRWLAGAKGPCFPTLILDYCPQQPLAWPALYHLFYCKAHA